MWQHSLIERHLYGSTLQYSCFNLLNSTKPELSGFSWLQELAMEQFSDKRTILNLSFSKYKSFNAGFRLTCRLPLCRVIIACCFRVAALSSNAALALSPSGIAPELNRIQLSAICRGGQSGKVIDLLAWRCLQLLAAWSSICGKWRLRSWTNIIIKAAIR